MASVQNTPLMLVTSIRIEVVQHQQVHHNVVNEESASR